jgi:hypothetical protein
VGGRAFMIHLAFDGGKPVSDGLIATSRIAAMRAVTAGLLKQGYEGESRWRPDHQSMLPAWERGYLKPAANVMALIEAMVGELMLERER